MELWQAQHATDARPRPDKNPCPETRQLGMGNKVVRIDRNA